MRGFALYLFLCALIYSVQAFKSLYDSLALVQILRVDFRFCFSRQCLYEIASKFRLHSDLAFQRFES